MICLLERLVLISVFDFFLVTVPGRIMSEASVIEDRSGVPFYYGDAAGVWLPPFPLPYPYKHQLDVIKNTVIRDDDVIMTGYGKSGM